MKRFALFTCACAFAYMLAGCATTPAAPPGTVVRDDAIEQAVQPGVTTRAMLLARFGATTSIRFDSGVEVWRYLIAPTAGAGHGEVVIVLDPRGVVAKVRRAPLVVQFPTQK